MLYIMEKASLIDLDSVVIKIMENELGLLLLEADKISFFDTLASSTTFKDRQGMHGNGCHITFHLFPIMYKNSIETTKLTESRASAINNIFERWTKCGHNKRNAKSPFSSKAFMKYINEIEFLNADYMLLMVD